MNLKVIRAQGDLYVPSNPENLKSRVVLVPTGTIHLVSEDCQLPEEKYVNVGIVRMLGEGETKRKKRTTKKKTSKKTVKET